MNIIEKVPIVDWKVLTGGHSRFEKIKFEMTCKQIIVSLDCEAIWNSYNGGK